MGPGKISINVKENKYPGRRSNAMKKFYRGIFPFYLSGGKLIGFK
jgi:hypothetical protein